jgi:hypothetical protein
VLLIDFSNVTLLSLTDRTEQDLIHFTTDAHSRPVQFTADGRRLLYERLSETPSLHLIDTESGEVQPLNEVQNYTTFPRPNSDWIILMGVLAGARTNNVQFVILDLESGQIYQILSLSGIEANFTMITYSPTGNTALLQVRMPDKLQLYLIDKNRNEAKLLAESNLLSSEYSPDGKYVVVGTMDYSDNKLSTEISVITTDNSESILLGEGIGPIWVVP